MSVLLGQSEGMGRKGHISLNLPGHWSFEEPVARLWLCLRGSCLQLKQNPSPHLSGAGVSQGIVAMSEAWRVSCRAACAGWRRRHLTPNHLLLLPSSSSALALLGWDWSPPRVCCRYLSPDFFKPFASLPQLHADRSPCASLAVPSSQHSFLAGWLGTVTFFFIFFVVVVVM